MIKQKFRKKPVVIEAYQTDKELEIETLEGTMHASIGDWIITGVNGEPYPCKPDIFEKSYEPAVEDKDAVATTIEQEPNEDCISRKRLRESLKKELAIVNNNEMYWQGWHDCTVAVEARITDALSVVPKHGEWIVYPLVDAGRVELECPICGDTSIRAVDYKPHFCENCGADMRGDTE